MNPLFSDHSPFCWKIDEQRDTKKRSFKFYNYLAQHSEFKGKIQASWTRKEGNMQDVWRNLKLVRYEMQNLNKNEFIGVLEKIKILRNEVMTKQSQMRRAPIPQTDLEEEKRLRQELNK